MNCRYKYCKHKSQKISGNSYILNGKSYYHTDCFEEKSNIDEIIKVFSTKINPNCVFAQLRSVVNNIVYTKGIAAEYLLFGLNFYIKNGLTLNYPQGLYYVIQNKMVEKAYNDEKAKVVKQKMKEQMKADKGVEEVIDFGYVPKKQSSFSDIIGG